MQARAAVVAIVVLGVLAIAGCGKSSTGDGGGGTEDTATRWGWNTEDLARGDDVAGGVDQESNPPDVELGGDAVTGSDTVGPGDVTAPGDATVEPDGKVVTPDVEDKPDYVENPECVDLDKDGYGNNCYLGKDCDDTNKNFTIYCPPCDQQNVEGCKCSQPGAQEVCYESDPGSVGIGECQLGMRSCAAGFWSACVGQVVPVSEECDEKDNDCDGQTDEGVLSACGNCDPFCDTLEVGPDSDTPFTPGEDNSSGVGLNIDGFLILDSSQINLSFIWVANSGEGTVSKLDTKTGKELGRYKVCGDPSRTSVDLVGNVWVGCRADGGVAKIAIDKAICVDKNGNGQIDTSEGPQVVPGDECTLFIVYPGGSCTRAAGVDADNHVWVGEWNAGMLRRLHPDDGHTVQEVDIPGNPYGLVVDGTGIVWVSGRGGDILVRVDPNQNPPSVNSWGVPGGNLYGITVDMHGKVWIGQYSNGTVARFDPNTNQFNTISIGGCPRGMAGSVDGFMYSGLGCSGNQVAKINVDTMQVTMLSTGSGQTPIGVALDSDGFVWAVCYSTSNAAKIDPVTNTVFGPYPVGSYPYTYSDMTGYALHNFTAPQGSYTTVFGGWEEFRVKWEALFVDAQIPANAYLKVEVRTGNTKEEVDATPWQGMFGPYPPENFPLMLDTLPNMDGKILQVRVWLFSADKLSTPVVKSIQAKFSSE